MTTRTRSTLARLLVAPLFLLGCSTGGDHGSFFPVKCPLEDGYYMGERVLEPDVLEHLVTAARAHCKRKNKCLLAITDDEIVCRDDYSTMPEEIEKGHL